MLTTLTLTALIIFLVLLFIAGLIIWGVSIFIDSLDLPRAFKLIVKGIVVIIALVIFLRYAGFVV